MQAGDYTVTASALWLREGPGTNFAQVALMPQNATFSADGGEQNGFSSGSFGVLKGWAATQYLAPMGQGVPQAAAPAAEIQAATDLEITGQDVALRSEPKISSPSFGAGSNVLTTTNANEVVTNNKIQDNGFQSVRYKNQDGWMSLLYLKPTQIAPTPGPMVQVEQGQPAPAPAPEVQTEIGPMTGGAVALGLLAVGLGIYFLAK